MLLDSTPLNGGQIMCNKSKVIEECHDAPLQFSFVQTLQGGKHAWCATVQK